MTDAPTQPQDPRLGESQAVDEPRYLTGTKSYRYAWAPVIIVFGTVTVLAVPYLAVVVLLGIVLAAVVLLAKLAWVGAADVYELGRSLPGRRRRWHDGIAVRESGPATERGSTTVEFRGPPTGDR